MTALIAVVLLLTAPAAPAQQLLAPSVARLYDDEDAENRTADAAPARRPPNVDVPDAYDDLLAEMLRSSPTFRAQCSRLGAARQLHVTVERSMAARAQAAVTRVVRYPDGRLDAVVEIGLFGDVAMLIAHEFEHVLEQLDGVNLAALADRRGTGVHLDSTTGQFETERAIAIGRRVAHEVSRAVARR